MRRKAHLSFETKDESAAAAERREGGLSFTELLDGMADELQRRTREARAGLAGRRRRAVAQTSRESVKPEADEPVGLPPEEATASEPAPGPIMGQAAGETVETAPAAEAVAATSDDPEARPGSDAALNEAIALVSQRLDDLNRKMAEGRQPPGKLRDGAGPKAAEKAAAPVPGPAPAAEPMAVAEPGLSIEDLLRGFEDGIAREGARSARPARPIGRRGPDAAEDIRNAVISIRARRDELDTREPAPPSPRQRPLAPAALAAPRPSQADVVAAVKADVVRIAGQLDALQAAPAAASDSLGALLAEIGRLQDSIGGVATRTDVGAVERAVRDLGARLPAPGIGSGAGGLADAGLRADLDRISGDISANVHGRLSRDLERLGRKMDAVSGLAQSSHALDTVARQLPEMQRRLDELGELKRLQETVHRVADLGPQLADLREDRGSLRPLLEEIRAGLDRSRRAVDQMGPDLSGQLDMLAERLDDLRRQNAASDVAGLAHRIEALSRSIEADRALPIEILDRVEDLSAKVGAAAAAPADLGVAIDRLSDRVEGVLARSGPDSALETVLARLDRIDERLRRKPGDPNSLEEMLRGLADRIEAAENPVAEAAALDALERQVGAISARLSPAAGRDPAVAALEHAMGDLTSQVAALREGAAVKSAPPKAYAALERDVAELKAHSTAQDRRLQSMLAGVQQTIEGLASRFNGQQGGPDRGSTTAATRNEGRAARPARAAPDARDVQRSPEATGPVRPRTEEVLLEPGSERPRNAVALAGREGQGGAALGDTKASFIAAARRAAQAAAAEAGQRRSAGRPEPGASSRSRRSDRSGVAVRLTRAFAARRRQALLGLAAVVLALGALQSKTGLITQKLATLGSPHQSEPGAAAIEVEAPVETRTARLAPPAPVVEPAGAVAKASPPGVPAETPRPPSAASEPAAPKATAPVQETKAEAPAAAPPAVETAAKPQSLVTGSIEPAGPKAPPPRLANVAAVGEIPSVSDAPGLRPAALSGDSVAVFELATRAAEGRGVARDPKLAAKLFEKAAAAGVVPAQYRIANQYEKGIGVTRDLGLAKLWYQRAAEAGNAKAMHNLAVLLADGAGVAPDYGSAGAWFRAAAERGIRDSQYNLAVLYTRGLGLKQDLVQSYTWFAIAAGQGDQDAAKKRDEVGQRLSAKDLAAAKEGAERWRPQSLDQAANEVVLPPGGWPEVASKKGPAAKKA